MLIISKRHTKEADLDGIKEYLVNHGFDFHQSTGADRTIIGVIGDTKSLDDTIMAAMPGVHQIVRIKPED